LHSSAKEGVSVRVAALLLIVVLGVGGISYVFLTHANQVQPLTSTASQSSSGGGPLGQSLTLTASETASEGALSSSASTFASSSSSSTTSSAPGPITHVIIILMENEEYGSVIGSASAPYENSLASTYALAADYYGVAHPSLPNYLALVAGSTFGVSSDCLPAQCSLPSNVTTIATLLDAHHFSWKEYAESMPVNCSQADFVAGLYYTKHNPFVYFDSITGNNGTGTTSTYCDSHVVSMDQFYTDLQAGNLPNYSFITPNICDDAHSCPLAAGDEWLATLVPKIINSSSFASTALFITYDEGNTNDTTEGGGQVPCILVSPFAKAGYVSNVEYTHYSLLSTVEGIFGLGNLGRNDSTAAPMSDLFTSQIHLLG
jgi:phosphatidylinositol-3-phosphatase